MKKSEVYLRIDKINPVHVHCTLFMHHAMIGNLVFLIEEYKMISVMMGIGADAMKRDVVFKTDDERFQNRER